MKSLSTLLIILLPFFAHSQIIYPNGPIIDSGVFAFTAGDTLIRHFHFDSAEANIDTAGATLWQIGRTIKPVFSGGATYNTGIMTDTSHPYPRNANSYFQLKMKHVVPNFVIDIYHKYQTDSLHAGGIIEYSTDTGNTWVNVANCSVINKVNIYSATDTLLSGNAAFMGNSHGQQLSRIQVFNCWAFKTTTTTCIMQDNAFNGVPFYIRFRFVSDTATDTLSGWMIDSIKIENPGCAPGSVPIVNNNNRLLVYPNPAWNTLTITYAGAINNVLITDPLGQPVYNHTYTKGATQQDLDITALPPGIYFIKVNSADVRKFVKR